MPKVKPADKPVNRRRPKRAKRRSGKVMVYYGWGAAVLIVISAVVLAYPFAKSWAWSGHAKKMVAPHFVPRQALANDQPATALTDEQRLLIPSIGVDSPIVEGPNESALNRGAWRIPGTSTPDQGGNTVISGHRFRYLPPNNTTLYLLNKLKPGDEVMVQWRQQLYHYRVVSTREVKPEQVEILDNTAGAQLTLFTCTPILSTARRLVVTSELVSVTTGR